MIRTSVREVTISEAEVGQRLDNFLLREFKGVPRSRIYKMFRKGEVRVNKGRIKPHYKIKLGDVIRIPPVNLESIKKAPYVPDSEKEIIQSSILDQDGNLIFINKPSGFPVHAGSKLPYGVIEAVRSIYPNQEYLELAHRLDRYTSGCLLLAKNRVTLQEIHDAMRDHTAIKHYYCLVAGTWPADVTEVNSPLKRDNTGKHSRTIVSATGKEARSVFTVEKSYADTTLMKVAIYTGRTHQIRVHAASNGHPIIGDELYGDQTFNVKYSDKGLSRQFLHASSIEMELSNNKRVFEAPLAADLSAILNQL